MDEVVLKNAELGVSMTKCKVNSIDVVWAENIREALEWDTVPHMVRGLKDGKEVMKIRISELDSTFSGLLPNLAITSKKGGRPMEYAYFLTRQGVTRLIATRRPHDVKDNPELAEKLDRLQDWIFGEVLPEVMLTGRYAGRPLVAGKHAIEEMPTKISDALRLMADEYDAHELTIGALNEAEKTKAQINNAKTATAMQTASVLSRKVRILQNDSDVLHTWKGKLGRPRKGCSPRDIVNSQQVELF